MPPSPARRTGVRHRELAYKRDLKAGERLGWQLGIYLLWLGRSLPGVRKKNALPIAVSLDCTLKRDIARTSRLRMRMLICRRIGSWIVSAPNRHRDSLFNSHGRPI